jgi:SsrA-binding protein
VRDDSTVALNRRARHEFTIDETFEAGLVLTGTEIKSVRAGKVNISNAYARIEKGEAWLIGADIDVRSTNCSGVHSRRARRSSRSAST